MFDSSPFIHPLLELLDEGRAVGVVLASRHEARLLEWRLGELSPLREMSAELLEPPHQRASPIGSRPGNRHGTPTGEQRIARERDQSARFIGRVAAAASRLAAERGRGRELVSGGEYLTDPLVHALPPSVGEITLTDPGVLVPRGLPLLADNVTERVRGPRRVRAPLDRTGPRAGARG